MTQLVMKGALLGDVWIIWLLVLLSVLSVAVTIERWRAYGSAGTGFRTLFDGVAGALEQRDVEAALQLATRAESVEGRIAAAGLKSAGAGPGTAEETMASQAVLERAALERRLIVLGTLGNNAPFIGLFGTVLGIIKAFHDLAISGSSGVAVVMAGISSALVATALGILVAIPAVVANNYFQVRMRGILANADSLSRLVLAHLKRAA